MLKLIDWHAQPHPSRQTSEASKWSLPEYSISHQEVMEVDKVDLIPSWMDLVTSFLSTGALLADKAQARRIRHKAVKNHLIDRILCKRGYTLPYLRCVHPSQVNNLLYKIHKGTCGSHVGGWAQFRRALFQGYFWMTMAQNSRTI